MDVPTTGQPQELYDMQLEFTYDSQNDIPAGYEDLYTEQGDKWVLTGVSGLPQPDSVDKLQSALNKERSARREFEKKAKAFEGLDPEEIQTQLAELEDLRTQREAGQIGSDDAKIQELVKSAENRVRAPLDSKITNLQKQLQEREQEAERLRQQQRRAQINQAVASAAQKLGVVPSAVADAQMLAERVFDASGETPVVSDDASGFTPGLRPEDWLKEVRESRPHWFQSSQGGGATGSRGPGGGSNPWKGDSWNLTEQGRIIREHGPDYADRLAKAAGHASATSARKPAS